VLPSAPALQDVGDATLGFWVKVGGLGVLVAVVHAFCTMGATVTGVMGRLMMEQLHFDGDPGIAVGVAPGPLKGYGKLGDGDTH
jgi:hypothetical protein